MSSVSTDGPAAARVNASERPSYRHYVLAVLMLAYVFNVIDRQVLGTLLQPIKDELQISDTLAGLLGGAAFAVFYSSMSVPIARLADRWSRVNVLTIAVGVWSVATATCAAAWSYASLFVSRAVVAVGEAGGTPPSHSLIADYFAPQRRATALAILAMAVPIGTAVGNLVTGWLNVWYGWRATFVLVGLPGLLVALLVRLTIKEPPRGRAEDHRGADQSTAPPFLSTLKFLLARSSFVHTSIAAALHSVVWYSGTVWNNTFFVRSHALNTGEAGSYVALFSLLGALGGFLGGHLADRLSTARGDARWYMWVPGIACAATVPVQLVAYLSSDLSLLVPASFSLMFVLASMFFGPSFAVAQSVATARMRTVAASVLLLVQTIIGYTIGPALVGIFSDLLTTSHGDDALRHALAAIGVINVWAAAHYFLAARRYREDLSTTANLRDAVA